MAIEEEAFSDFLSSYPQYKDTLVIDQLRHVEYPHLNEKNQVCLDYTGVGIFSGTQKSSDSNDGGFGIALSYIASNLATHAMYVDDDSVEGIFRKRILRYLSLNQDEYYIVFTANALSAFKLLGESYPFHEAQNLLHAYDHVCENVDAITECARAKAASVHSVHISYPCLKVDSEDLQKKLQRKKKAYGQKSGSLSYKGLFAYPYSSRVTGRRNSSQWITEAQQNGWHVLLDVTCADPKMFDSLGFSIFQPDFLICSFYTLFGEDPSGFGCLVMKKLVLRTLGDSFRARAIGMVEIVSRQTSSPSTSRRTIKFPKDSSAMHVKEEHQNKKCDYKASNHMLTDTLFCKGSDDKSENERPLQDRQDTASDHFVKESSPKLSSSKEDNPTGGCSESQQMRILLDSNDMHTCGSATDNSKHRITPCVRPRSWPIHQVASCSDAEPSQEEKLNTKHSAEKMAEGDIEARYAKEIKAENVSDFPSTSAARCSCSDGRENLQLESQISEEKITTREEPEIPCKGLDHADNLGYVKISTRLRCLASWLTLNLLKLRHSPSHTELVRFYSQITPSECGSTIAFSLLDSRSEAINPERVQMLADRHGISMRTGVIEVTPSPLDPHHHDSVDKSQEESILGCVEFSNYKRRSKVGIAHKVKLPVNCVSLSFLNSFSDVFQLWQFISKFLQPEFVHGELWHYQALNQETIQI